jgi:MinD-like ATPase involved in chromosome partitioning or flagellar assembly
MSGKHPVDPPPEWDATWDDSAEGRTRAKDEGWRAVPRRPSVVETGAGSARLGVMNPEEGRNEMTKPGNRPGTAGEGSAPEPTPASAAPPAPRGASGTEPAANPRDWIYGQLGLSRENYRDAVTDRTPGPPPPPPPAAPSRGAPNPQEYATPFPPGSLGGGLPEPETRVFHGFPKPGSGAGPASAEPTSPTVPRPSPRTPEPAAKDNPFRVYDERIATGNIPLPPSALAARVEEPRPSAVEVSAALADTADRLSADSLTAEKVLRRRRRVPRRGWRRNLLSASGGVINVGPSGKERRDLEFTSRVRTPITACHRLAMISLKGGVGKTTTTAALGSVFAALRTDRVIAVDGNPDRGTLGDKIVTDRPNSTVRDFVRRAAELDRYSAVREFTGMANSRLEVLASESDPLASTQFSEHDYRIIADILERYYNLILTDCGTGLMHSAMVGVLAKADQLVIVSTASLDGARSASATLDWLEAHGYAALARESVTVITSVRPKATAVDLEEIVSHFARRTRAVVAIPHDEHLAAGGTIDLRAMSRGAYEAHLQLAAEIADAFV